MDMYYIVNNYLEVKYNILYFFSVYNDDVEETAFAILSRDKLYFIILYAYPVP